MITLLFSMAALTPFLPIYATPPPVDGVLEVPWESTTQQTEVILKKKGFKKEPLDKETQRWVKENMPPGYGEIAFKGTVANHYAYLSFRFQNNSFFEGFVHFMDPNYSFSKKQYSSEWMNGQFILNLYDEIKGMLISKYSEPESERGNRAEFVISNYESRFRKNITTGWSLTGGTSGDKIAIVCQGCSPYYISVKDNLKTPGSVSVTYTNQSLQKRLLNNKPVNRSNDL